MKQKCTTVEIYFGNSREFWNSEEALLLKIKNRFKWLKKIDEQLNTIRN